MNERLRWWALPAAMVVLLRVVTLDGTDAAPEASAPDADDGVGAVAVLEASGRRSMPLPAPVPARAGAFFVSVPAAHAGARGAMTLWRRTPVGREATPWLAFAPRVPADATIKVAGLAAGCYDVEWRLDDTVLLAEAVAVPGAVELQPAAAPPR